MNSPISSRLAEEARLRMIYLEDRVRSLESENSELTEQLAERKGVIALLIGRIANLEAIINSLK